ncbi:MAG: hypothetical protein WA912_02420 [Ornithinimicrobium sp.]
MGHDRGSASRRQPERRAEPSRLPGHANEFLGSFKLSKDDDFASTATAYEEAHRSLIFEIRTMATDIIREQLDGATAIELAFAIEGREGNDYVTPCTPASS